MVWSLVELGFRTFEADNVPTEHRPLVEGANEYLRLRDESWRLRADALRKHNLAALRKADRAEWESLEAFGRIKPNEKTDKQHTTGPAEGSAKPAEGQQNQH